jgi:TRAP transporter 4TM/12TM fusion protein
VIHVTGALIAAIAIGWSLDLQTRAGALIYAEQLIAVMLGLGVFGVYWKLPPILGRRWINRACAMAALAVMLWIGWRFPVLQADMLGHPREAITLSVLALGLLVDSCRRCSGWSMPAIFGAFFLYALIGHLVPGLFQTKEVAAGRLVSYLALDSSSLLGQTMIIVCTTVLAFMIFDKVLQACGGGDWFTDLSASLFGRYRGGPGKVEVVASAFFGGISGSALANVMSTGIITIPNMKKAGYTPETAAAVEAVSSTGGQIVPPVMGAAAFLMAENLQMRYADVAVAAIVPAALYFFSVYIQVDHEAAARGIGGTPRSELPRFGDVLRRGWFFLLPFIALFALMFQFNVQPEEAVLYSLLALLPFAFLIGYAGQRLTWRKLGASLVATGRESFDLLVICGVASAVIGLLNITGLALSLGFALIKIGNGSMVVLLVLVAVICFILGLGLPTTGVYLLVAVLAAPPLVQLGVPALAAHMFVLYHGCLSMITPPIALAAYAAAHIAGADPMRVGWRACRLGWPAFALPFVFAWSPELLLIGKPLDIGAAILFATFGVWLGTAAVSGFFIQPLAPGRRWGAGAAAVLMLAPGGHALHFAGLALGLVIVALEFRRKEAAA